MIEKTARFVKVVFVMFVILSLSSLVMAQDATAAPAAAGGNLSYSAPVSGEITDTAFTQNWTLQTASADRISVRVERTDGNLIPDVAILDANGQSVQTSYGADRTGAVSVIDNFTLPTGGTYQIQVGRKDADTGVTSGKYSLVVMPNATAEDNPNNTLVIGPVEADTAVSGEITGAHWYDRYTFTAQGADVIRVTAKRTSGTLFPEIEVLDVNGTSLQTGYTEYTGDLAQIDQVTLPAAGQYTVAVTRESRFNGYTAGKFDLTVALLGAGEDSPMLAPAAGHDVVYGQPLQGTIDARWYDDWKLTTDAGDNITLTVTSDAATSDVAGNLQPEVILLGGSGQELNHGYTEYDGASATIDRYSLNSAGTYTVRVSRKSGKTGLSSGPYTLMATLNGSGEGSAKLTPVTGTVETGTAVDGQVTNERWADSWTYQGQAGQAIDVIVTRTSGTLIPLVAILDANGQQLTSGYYDPTWDRVALLNYTLPGAGEYKIVVSRDGDVGGYTSGGYNLLIRPHSNQ
ncbi:MAG: hypothetical protein ABI690_03285 [Chloroflexota bacterium]